MTERNSGASSSENLRSFALRHHRHSPAWPVPNQTTNGFGAYMRLTPVK